MIRDFAVDDSAALRALVVSNPAAPDREAVPIRPAATVMLVRDALNGKRGSSGVEVFMLQRVETMAFAPSTLVFPGGGADPRDQDERLPWAGPEAGEWARRLACPPAQARMLVVAAVREVFEECGALLASKGPDGPLADASDQSWVAVRERLVARAVSFAELLIEWGLVLRSDLLRAHAHWITPAFRTRRYDTRFFVALMPEGQTADDKTSEAELAGWFGPADVLAACRAGQAVMMPPTIVCLEDIAAFPTAADFFAHTPEIHPVEPVLTTARDGSLVVRADLKGRQETKPDE